jgi:flavin-dependent dehydrogenase
VKGLLAIGDAASFIDPFTGSGMLMALESGELAADTIAAFLDQQPDLRNLNELRTAYSTQYHKMFDTRLKLSSLLRRAAFVPGLAAAAIALVSTSDVVRRKLAQATRGSRPETSDAAMRLR